MEKWCNGDEDDREKIPTKNENKKTSQWAAVDLETAAIETGFVTSALRSYGQWDLTLQARAVNDFPIVIRKIANGSPGLAFPVLSGNDHPTKCLQDLRLIKMSRIIASPVAGKTFVAHGSDSLWVTSPNLLDRPGRDRDLARGKRTVQLDLDVPSDRQTLDKLLEDCHVFIQGYRPGSMAHKCLSAESLAQKSRDGLVYASLSAYGIDVSGAEHFGDGAVSMNLPCQALDHAAGYMLAAGVNAVGRADVAKYMKSLGQYERTPGFSVPAIKGMKDVLEEYFETRETAFGVLKAVKHSAQVENVDVGFERMPKPLGSDRPE